MIIPYSPRRSRALDMSRDVAEGEAEDEADPSRKAVHEGLQRSQSSRAAVMVSQICPEH